MVVGGGFVEEREMSCLYFLWGSLYYFNEFYVKIKTGMLGEL